MLSLTLRACTGRVIVLGLCVCVCMSVYLSMAILALQAMGRPMSDTSGFRTMTAWKKDDFPEMTAFRRYAMRKNQYTNWATAYFDQLLPIQHTTEAWNYSRTSIDSNIVLNATIGAASLCLEQELTLSTIMCGHDAHECALYSIRPHYMQCPYILLDCLCHCTVTA